MYVPIIGKKETNKTVENLSVKPPEIKEPKKRGVRV